MGFLLFSGLVLLAIVGVLQSLFLILAALRGGLSHTSVFSACGGVCLFIGVISFMAPAFIEVTDLELPESFEWPLAKGHPVLIHPSGHFVALHKPTGRVQIYDSQMRFVRGFMIERGGLNAAIRMHDHQNIVVFTAPRFEPAMKYVYTFRGNLVIAEPYKGQRPHAKGQFTRLRSSPAIYLWVFTHPIKGWVFAFIGMMLAKFAQGYRRWDASADP